MSSLQEWSALIMEERKYPTTEEKAREVVRISKSPEPIVHITLLMEVLPVLLKSYHVALDSNDGKWVWIKLFAGD